MQLADLLLIYSTAYPEVSFAEEATYQTGT